jgi:hypothetical protein
VKITLIVSAIVGLLGTAMGWGLTHGYYRSVLAENALALSQAQQRADSLALFAQTQSTLVINQIDATYQEKLHEQDALHARDLADVRSGALRLRDSGAKCPAQVSAAPGASVGDGQAGAELSAAATEFLLSEAERADRVAIQLGACQQVIESDRKTLDQLFNRISE